MHAKYVKSFSGFCVFSRFTILSQSSKCFAVHLNDPFFIPQ